MTHRFWFFARPYLGSYLLGLVFLLATNGLVLAIPWLLREAIDGIELGSRSINVATAPVVEGVNIGGADGILGLDSLQGQRVLLDFKEKAIHVANAIRGGATLVHGVQMKNVLAKVSM